MTNLYVKEELISYTASLPAVPRRVHSYSTVYVLKLNILTENRMSGQGEFDLYSSQVVFVARW